MYPQHDLLNLCSSTVNWLHIKHRLSSRIFFFKSCVLQMFVVVIHTVKLRMCPQHDLLNLCSSTVNWLHIKHRLSCRIFFAVVSVICG